MVETFYAPEHTYTIGAGSSDQIAASNPRRIWIGIQNIHAANTAWIMLGKIGAASTGLQLNPGGGYIELNLTNPWTGEIYCIADGAGTTINVVEVTG